MWEGAGGLFPLLNQADPGQCKCYITGPDSRLCSLEPQRTIGETTVLVYSHIRPLHVVRLAPSASPPPHVSSPPTVQPAQATIAPETKQAVDFFGRAIVTKALQGEDGGGEGDAASAALAPRPPKRARQAMYRFNEGFSNAVRVTKRLSDFLA